MTRNTKISAWALAAAAIAAQCLAQPILADAASEATRPIALKAAHLFDSVSGKMVEHGVVVVSGSKIQAVGSDVKIPDNAQVIDLGDATCCRVSSTRTCTCRSESSPNWYHDWFDSIMRFPAEQALYGAHYAKVTLEAGITTVRDLGSGDYIALGTAQCHQRGPDSGPAHAGVQLCDRIDAAAMPIKIPVPPQRIAVAGTHAGRVQRPG